MVDLISAVRSTIFFAGVLVLVVPLTSCSEEGAEFDVSTQIGPDPVLPEPYPELMPDLKIAEVVGWPEGRMPAVPHGLKVTAYAIGLANPRTLHTLPNGDVLVVQGRGPKGKPLTRPKDIIRSYIMSWAQGGGPGPQKESNLITLLQDKNRDGQVDTSSDLLSNLHSPFGVAWFDDTLYVAATDAILAYPYRLGESKITAAPKVLTRLPGGPINHHWTKDLALSPDGRFLYASVGSNSNVAERGLEAEKQRAAIWQVDRTSGAACIFASGLRNSNGLTFHPETGVLWTVVNERDELGPNLVPDYLTSVQGGGFYGWPWSYFGNHVDERVHPPRPDLVEQAIKPDYALSSHVAPLGLTFSNGSALPEPYANGAFIGEHGSWNRNMFNGYKVVYVPFRNGMPAGIAQDVVTGFLNGDQAFGRPVGVAIDGTGALLVADDAGNTVWRVAATDGSVTPNPTGTDQITVSALDTAAAPNELSSAEGTATPQAEGETASAPDVTGTVAPAPAASGWSCQAASLAESPAPELAR